MKSNLSKFLEICGKPNWGWNEKVQSVIYWKFGGFRIFVYGLMWDLEQTNFISLAYVLLTLDQYYESW